MFLVDYIPVIDRKLKYVHVLILVNLKNEKPIAQELPKVSLKEKVHLFESFEKIIITTIDENIRAGSHTDYGSLTKKKLMDCDGLEIQHPFTKVVTTYKFRTYLIRFNGIFWTMGLFKSTKHRVTYSQTKRILTILTKRNDPYRVMDYGVWTIPLWIVPFIHLYRLYGFADLPAYTDITNYTD
ncbi:hypothetical protein RhiirC2_843602 [Rhizophagus irregularis]|uniref:Uncharacterized protein n=1 Tax=Rhizophagus irregularis TaxID=588596 RepID=A0A2N1NWN0_9GLOM|nr:hypothetical protein RhiirC2_843602 [Rhizophagus irregularis]